MSWYSTENDFPARSVLEGQRLNLRVVCQSIGKERETRETEDGRVDLIKRPTKINKNICPLLTKIDLRGKFLPDNRTIS